jgi:hypothetical protein
VSPADDDRIVFFAHTRSAITRKINRKGAKVAKFLYEEARKPEFWIPGFLIDLLGVLAMEFLIL